MFGAKPKHMFTPSRLTLARERRRLTKKALAKVAGVTAHTVLRWESGESAPWLDEVCRLSQILDFPQEFFFEPDIDPPQADAASFRSMSAMSAKERDGALAAGALAFVVSDWIDERFELPEANLIDMEEDKPEAAARSLRESWGLGERPIKNMVNLLEANGVRLFSMAENTMAVDAFSMWRREQPYVFLNTMKTAEHSRLDAAHELGHLILHKHGGPKGRKAEDEANLFASSFLMPEADVRATLPRIHTLNQILEAKKRWGVSAMSLIVRLNRLKIMTDWQYRMFCIDATELGFRKAEPFGIPREKSVVWQKILTTLWNERTTKDSIAKTLHIPVGELENLLFGLAGDPLNDEMARRPPLRLISG
jgi:Zn-dependent peptidase ImmA (M78 family)/DNA-binding XRE family transcriptional regulator